VIGWLLLRANWKLAAGGLFVAMALGGWGYVTFLRRDAEHEKAAATAAVAQTKVADAATQAVDHYATQTLVIREKADAANQTIQAAAGADTPLPEPVRGAWLDGLRQLRDGSGDTDDQPSAQPAGQVRGARAGSRRDGG
jgi:hypothetical protein